MTDDHGTRLLRARRSLEGLSLGDAFGEQFFGPEDEVLSRMARRALPPAPWPFTDDTVMALAAVETLASERGIDCDVLAGHFSAAYARDPGRGYGGTAHRVLRGLGAGEPWREVSTRVFGGGSMGNGAAMRVAPIGAYFADDFTQVTEHAARSAAPTHAHADAAAGAIAVAVATALAWRGVDGSNLLSEVLSLTPEGDTYRGLARACALPFSTTPEGAARILGNGSRMVCSDTVPFALWCAARHLDDFEAALWTTVSGLGDRDTTSAIVGGIVAMRAPLPTPLLAAREALAWPIPRGPIELA